MVANTTDDVCAVRHRVDAPGCAGSRQGLEPRHVRALCVVANTEGVPAEGQPAQGSFVAVVVEGGPEILGNPAERLALFQSSSDADADVALGWLWSGWWRILSSGQAFNRSWAGPARPLRKPNGESDPTMP